MKKVFTFLLLNLFQYSADAQCKKTITLDDKEYCIISCYDGTLIEEYQSYHFCTSIFTPIKGKLVPGYYIAFDERTKRIALCFYINPERNVEGLELGFSKCLQNKDPKIGGHCEVGLGDGNYAFLGEMLFFEFSQETFEKINDEVTKKYMETK